MNQISPTLDIIQQNRFYDEDGNYYNLERSSYQIILFFQNSLFSIAGFALSMGFLFYAFFIGLLIFLLNKMYLIKKLKIAQQRRQIEQKFVATMTKTLNTPGVYLYDGSFVPKWEYDGCCLECLLLTKQLVSPVTCQELKFHKLGCSPISNSMPYNNIVNPPMIVIEDEQQDPGTIV